MAPLKIAIVGAGIGGPAVAIALARNGHKVTLYDRLTNTSEVGYAFRITPNSDRCLKYLGVDTIAGGAVAANSGRLMDKSGRPVHGITENTDAEKAKRGTSVFAYRVQNHRITGKSKSLTLPQPLLHQQLMEVALASGVEKRFGVQIESVDVEKTQLVLSDGSTVSVDIIIAADGVHSVVRPHIIDTTKHFPTPSTGHSAFRFMVSKPICQKDKLMSSIISNDTHFMSWGGDDRRILVYPVNYDKQFNITCTHPKEMSEKEGAGGEAAAVGKLRRVAKTTGKVEGSAYNQVASFETALDIYKDFDPVALRLFHLAHPNGLRVWTLQDMDEIPTWSKNHTVLLGDACHPVSPFGFSGASMAIEDAITLAELLPKDVEVEDLEERFKLYEQIRKPRVGRVRDTARKIARGADSREVVGPYMQWLAGYDALEETKNALARHSEAKG
ncbi:MAG: hypothetical protein Q9218_001870 [Villophora microphyllina]